MHFAGRDERNRSQGGWVDVRLDSNLLRVERAARNPSLTLGRLGAFDDCGAMPGCIVMHDGRMLMFYTGWTLAREVPFFFFVGLAESRDSGETFTRLSEAPVLGRNHFDPFLTGAPWVLNEGGTLRMWYISGTEWIAGSDGSGPIHYYSIKHATSRDGRAWETNDRLCLPYLENEHAIARPVVTRTADGYSMIYSARRLGETYRIYGARSRDGLEWERDPDPLVDVADFGMGLHDGVLRQRTGQFGIQPAALQRQRLWQGRLWRAPLSGCQAHRRKRRLIRRQRYRQIS